MKIYFYYKFYCSLYAAKKKYIKIRPNTTDLEVFKEIFIKGELKLKENINPKLIIDCGAYVGFSALFFSNKYSSSIIYAIEPEFENYNALKFNCRDEKRIIPINAAIWDSEAILEIQAGKGEWGFTTKEVESASSKTISGITIQEILNISGLESIDILKVDIEGAEYQMFNENCHSWLSKVKLIFIELHENSFPSSSKTFYESISKYNWKKFTQGEKLVLIREF
ncbi:MAG: FkbM family methyltransferase [Flavobacterium sp.]|nr:FkbM family methyltransferase [Flavobacterium sp.]